LLLHRQTCYLLRDNSPAALLAAGNHPTSFWSIVMKKPATYPTIASLNLKPGDRLLSCRQLAGHFGVCEFSIREWARKKLIPKGIRLGAKCVRWVLSEVLAADFIRLRDRKAAA
jgi:predicted DNA-binding transcriptional regulator AlpA